MSDNVEALYQEIILDHYKHPRGAGLLDEAEIIALRARGRACR